MLSTKTELNYQRFYCRECCRKYNERTGTAFNFLEYSTDLVMLVVLWRLRYALSLREVVELCLLRGVTLTHETVRDWEQRFAPYLTDHLKRRRKGKCSTRWHVDETYVKVSGVWIYYYRAIDRDGNLVDTMMNKTTGGSNDDMVSLWDSSRLIARRYFALPSTKPANCFANEQQ